MIPWRLGVWVNVWSGTLLALTHTHHATINKRPGAATTKLSTQQKHLKYVNINSRGMHLVVVRVVTKWVYCSEGKSWIYEILNKLMEKTGNKESRSYLIQRRSKEGTQPNNVLLSIFYFNCFS